MKRSMLAHFAGTAAAVLLMQTAAVLPTVSAENAKTAADAEKIMLVNSDFEGETEEPWTTYAHKAASLEAELKDGAYYINIVENGGKDVGGQSRWDVQFRCGGLNLQKWHTYLVRCEVTPDADGEIYTKIGNIEGDIEVWHNGYGKMSSNYGVGNQCIKANANETLVFECRWACNQDMPNAEWAFQFGGAGDYQTFDCFPNGTTLKFDNLSIEDITVDPLSYRPDGDVDCDGKRNISDVILLSRYCTGDAVDVTDCGVYCGDIYQDGILDMNDVSILLEYIAALRDSLPVKPE